ncbi:hypothetical protein [Polaribacter sp.]|uniref:hypothetical protein n=1 Tax=Polaribacter sp. TaxID=1920175 RepID=UPI003EF80C11
MYYKSLFNINIHHGYFLDKGNEKFLPIDVGDDEMTEEDKKLALSVYSLSDYLTIKPTSATQKICKNYKVIFKKSTSGFRVLVNTKENKPIIPFEDHITFTFALQFTDAYFQNYTNMSSLSENEMYLFTNVVPENQVDFENIFENNGGAINAKFSLDEIATRNLIQEIAAEDDFFLPSTQFSISNAIQLVNEDKALENNQPKKDEKITEILHKAIQLQKQQHILGYVRLTIKGDNVEENLLTYINDEQFVEESHPVFTISFINRKTKWRFFSAIDEKIFITKEEKWLSKNGFTEIIGKPPDLETPSDLTPEPDKDYQFPNPTIESITNQDNVDYSEIFI